MQLDGSLVVIREQVKDQCTETRREGTQVTEEAHKEAVGFNMEDLAKPDKEDITMASELR